MWDDYIKKLYFPDQFMASGTRLHLTDSNLFFSLPFQASCSNKFPLHFFFSCSAFTYTIPLSHFSPNESDPIVNGNLKIMCSIRKKWLTSLLFQLAELTHFPGSHMLDLAMPQARLSLGKGKGGVQCQCSGATQHMASQKAPWTGSREHGSTKVAATPPTHCPADT